MCWPLLPIRYTTVQWLHFKIRHATKLVLHPKSDEWLELGAWSNLRLEASCEPAVLRCATKGRSSPAWRSQVIGYYGYWHVELCQVGLWCFWHEKDESFVLRILCKSRFIQPRESCAQELISRVYLLEAHEYNEAVDGGFFCCYLSYFIVLTRSSPWRWQIVNKRLLIRVSNDDFWSTLIMKQSHWWVSLLGV